MSVYAGSTGSPGFSLPRRGRGHNAGNCKVAFIVLRGKLERTENAVTATHD